MKFSFNYLRRRFALSPAESRVALFVLCALGASVMLRLWKTYLTPQTQEMPRDYTVLDSVFAARTAHAVVPESDTGSGAGPYIGGNARHIFSAEALLDKKSVPAPRSIDVNSAPQELLMQLPSIGPSIAGRIIAFRHIAPFRKLADLKRVKGIGKKKFARIEPFVKIE